MRLALLALLLLAPLARAQDLAVEVDAFPFPLKPLVQTGTAEVRTTAPCGEDVTFTTESPSDRVRASVDPPSIASPACEGTWPGKATLRVTLEADAPAMEPIPVGVRAHAGASNLSAWADVRAAFVGILDVQANQTEATVQPQRVATFEVGIVNLGNGNAKVTFEVLQQPREVTVPTPPGVTVQPGQRVTVPISAHAAAKNGVNDGTAVFTLLLRSAHALHPDQAGESETLSFVVHVRGTYVPAAPAWAVLAGGALLAATVRKARDT